MAHDVVIRGGTIVDGTGTPPYLGDIAIDGARITVVGSPGAVDANGETEIDAAGAIVTPGFIDLHTHYDAQVAWDRLLTPSSLHGITTVLMGNCGMTFAPVRPGGARRLAEMMETVEEIDAEAILQSMPWSWESYGEFLDFVEQCGAALNVAGMVGHCALRYYVMGERAVDEQPTEDEIAELARLTADALDQGAAGFSTSRFPGHRLPDRRFVPGTFATPTELHAIAGVLKGRGLFQAVLNTADLDPDMDLLTDIGVITGGRVLVASAALDHGETRYKQPTPDMLARALERGADITATMMPREGGSICGLYAKLPWRSAAWKQLDATPHRLRLTRITDPLTRRALIDEARDARAMCELDQIFYMGRMGEGVARYNAGPSASLAALAGAAGESPAETFLRMAEESQGRAMFSAVRFNRDYGVLESLLSSDRVLPGLGDSGAHMAGIVDSSYTTFFLSYWVRDRGVVELAEAVRRLTSAPAGLLGARNRGRLAPGAAADVNVIDLDSLDSFPVEVAYDAPLGGSRLTQRARGYRATFVNGQAIVDHDVHTGNHPGQVLRRF